MNRKVLDLNIAKEQIDGSCFVKCLQEVYRYCNKPITTTKIVALTDGLVFNTEDVSQGKLWFHMKMDLLQGIMLEWRRMSFGTLEEGLAFLKKEIENGRPVIMSVNTYYIRYTDDYLKLSGGFFHGGHMLVLHGFDEEKQIFIVSDPVFQAEAQTISYKELSLAWTYTKDAGDFEPLLCYAYLPNDSKPYISAMRNALKNFAVKYFEDDVRIEARHTWNQVRGISTLVDLLEEYMEKPFDSQTIQMLNNINYSIFHTIRWQKKSAGYFLSSQEFSEYEGLKKQGDYFKSMFEQWTIVSGMLTRAIQREDVKKLRRVREKMITLVEEEITHVEEILNMPI